MSPLRSGPAKKYIHLIVLRFPICGPIELTGSELEVNGMVVVTSNIPVVLVSTDAISCHWPLQAAAVCPGS